MDFPKLRALSEGKSHGWYGFGSGVKDRFMEKAKAAGASKLTGKTKSDDRFNTYWVDEEGMAWGISKMDDEGDLTFTLFEKPRKFSTF